MVTEHGETGAPVPAVEATNPYLQDAQAYMRAREAEDRLAAQWLTLLLAPPPEKAS